MLHVQARTAVAHEVEQLHAIRARLVTQLQALTKAVSVCCRYACPWNQVCVAWARQCITCLWQNLWPHPNSASSDVYRPENTEHQPPSPAAMQTEETDYEAAVEVSQALRSNMQREARLSYKFEV